MANSDEQTRPPGPDFGRDGFQALPLTLSARLACGETPLSELRLLEAGSVVALETQVGEPAELIAEGRQIGAGEIVEIKGVLSFRITRLGS